MKNMVGNYTGSVGSRPDKNYLEQDVADVGQAVKVGRISQVQT